MTSIEVPYSIAAALPTLSVMDVTNDVAQTLVRSGRSDGIAYIHATHGRSLIRIQERETGFFEDLEGLLERNRPERGRRARAPCRGAACATLRAGAVQGRRALPRSLPTDPALLARRGASERMDAHVAGVSTAGRSRARQRCLAGLALGLVAMIAELAGRSLTLRLDVGRHVGRVSYAHADYYPFLLAGVKIGVALMLARLAWRVAKAHLARVLHGTSLPRSVRARCGVRRGCASSSRGACGFCRSSSRHRSISCRRTRSRALPATGISSVRGCTAPRCRSSPCSRSSVAVVFRTVELWLSDYEELARTPSRSSAGSGRAGRRRTAVLLCKARSVASLFGLAFESRPPPLVV
jgi:Uncharacterized conserved protein